MRVSLALILVLAACATSPPPAPVEETLITPPPTAASAPAEPEPEPEAPLPAPTSFRRSEVLSVLDRGPADFLSSIDQDALVEGGQFHGWIFRGWRDRRYAIANLHPGDIIVRISGRPIERPDQFQQVWEALRAAPELVVEVQREGRPLTLRWPIKD